MGVLWVILLAPSPAHAVCGDGAWEESEACDDGNDVASDACNGCRLTCGSGTIHLPLTTHTCGHGAHGPFESVAAQSYPGPVFTDISASHTYFTLTLSGAAGENRSAVIYGPGTTGLYPFYLKQAYPLAVFTSGGSEVPLLFEHEVACGQATGALTWVKVYELERTEVYTIVFGPTDAATASVAIELQSAYAPMFRDMDGDGYGGALVGGSGCDYADPAVVGEGGDCDDEDASAHPGATEACDGADHDCARDEDTSHEGLCEDDEAGAACVNAGAAVRCGCAVDADCEGEATCNVVEQRCELTPGAAGGSSGEGGQAGAAAGEPSAAGETAAGGTGAPGVGGEPSSPGTSSAPASKGGCSYLAGRRSSSGGLGWVAALGLVAWRRRHA